MCSTEVVHQFQTFRKQTQALYNTLSEEEKHCKKCDILVLNQFYISKFYLSRQFKRFREGAHLLYLLS